MIKDVDPGLYRDYALALEAFLAAPGEEGREKAYQVGRSAVDGGWGVMDLIETHRQVLAQRPALDAAAALEAMEFLAELLSPYEMVLRGAREANAALRGINRTLETKVRERTGALKAAEEKYRKVMERAGDAILVVEGDGTILEGNVRAAELFGKAAGALAGAALEGLLGPGQAGHLGDLLGPGSRGGVLEGNLKLSRPGGMERTVEASVAKAAFSGKEVSIVILRDITERVAAQKALQESQQRFFQVQKLDAVGRLAGGVAHDFNNLLTAILGYAEILESRAEQEERPENLQDIKEILSAGQRATRLTRQLLAFSRQDAVSPQPVDLNGMVSGMEAMLRRLIPESIHLTLEPGRDLRLVLVDPVQAEQVLLNLALNARDAMPQGGTMTLRTENVDLEREYEGFYLKARKGSYVALTVSDTGTGMDRETQHKVFEPFFTTKEKGKGTGLGLAAVYGILQHCGGSIWIYSEPGKGSVFKAYFPVTQETAGQAAPRQPKAADAAGTGETVLVAEDDPSIRKMVVQLLKRSGYKVLAASGGEEALKAALAADKPVDLLLTDMVMPGMGGLELAEQLKSRGQRPKVLFMSGYDDSGHRGRDGKDPDWAHLQKPFALADLKAKIRSMLG